jgi:hypothetical protein
MEGMDCLCRCEGGHGGFNVMDLRGKFECMSIPIKRTGQLIVYSKA